MQRDKVDKSNKPFSSVRRQWVWIMLMVNLVFILLLMTLGVVALQVGNAMPENVDMLFIVAKKPSVNVGSEENGGVKKWESGKNVEIFKSSYQNGDGVFTVASKNGDKLFAPGTTAKYVFIMQNDGNMAVDYVTDLQFSLQISDKLVENDDFPIKVRLYNDRGEYLIGDNETYVSVFDAVNTGHIGLLGASSYDTYTLELNWPFDGDDELDTYLGNLSQEKGVTLTLKINVYAEEALDPAAKGGNKIEVEGTEEFGGTVRWLWLILLMLNASILIFYVAWLLNKRAIDRASNNDEN